MNTISNRESYHFTNNKAMNEELLSVIRETVGSNNPVGTLVGYYDDKLTIIAVSEYFLNNLGYTLEEFTVVSQNSLKKIVYGNVAWLTPEKLRAGGGFKEGRLMTADGTPVAVRMFKNDSIDETGRPVWVISVRIDWEYENLVLLNKAISSSYWFMDCDKNGNIVKVNWSQGFRQMLGFHDTNDFPNVLASWADRLHPDYKELTLGCFYETIKDRSNQQKYNVDYRMRTADGSYHWFRAIAEVIRRADGSASRIAGVFINIDKIVQSRQRLQKVDAFHHALTKSNLCEYYVDLQNNSFESLKVGETLLSIFQESRTWDDLIQNFVDKYVCEEYKEAVKRFYDRGRIAVLFAQSDEQLCLECEIMVDGERRWMMNVVLPGELNGSRYAMIFLRDINEMKRQTAAHNKLVKENKAMEHLVDGMAQVVDHFVVCDLENDTYEYHNVNVQPKYPAHGKYSELIDIVGQEVKTLAPLPPIEQCISIANIRHELFKPDDIYKFEYCSLDEHLFRVASIVPLEWHYGLLTKVLWISMDMTDVKKNEIESRRVLTDAFKAAERANTAKTEFLSNMSHDLRTPMNAIVGLTALAGANLEHTDRVRNCLNKIAGSSRHLLGLINNVLDMARIESGKIALVDEEFDFSELVENMVAMAKPLLDEHNHKFEVNVKHIEHEAVCGDSLRIQQLIMNFMTNAIKYTPCGGNIRFTIEENPNGFSELGCFRFIIEDNGIGMSEDFQKIMFEPFTRADDKRTTKVPGTGLGMAIAQNIVNMMNGSIAVDSAPNKGTKITTTIYLKLQEKEYEKVKELANLPVLVVDDDIVCCESAVATLNSIGLAGEWVTSGNAAVELTYARHSEKNDFFAIIMDWKMPGMDGIETTRQIRKVVGHDVTIIMLTSYDYTDIMDEAREAGVDGFIEKPLFRSKLTAALKKFVEPIPEKTAKDYMDELKGKDYSNKRILLVEDNELNREIAASIISMSKVQIETAENGKDAVEKVMQAPEGWYDLIFMDIQMPIMDGYKATAAIRSLDGTRKNVPIVAMTANAFAEDVQMAENTGMNGHLAKPLDLKVLNAELRKWLE